MPAYVRWRRMRGTNAKSGTIFRAQAGGMTAESPFRATLLKSRR